MIYGFAFIILILLAALFKMMQSGKEEETVSQTTARVKAVERGQATTETEAAEGVHTIAEVTARARAAEKNEAQKTDTPRLETVTTKDMEQEENKEKMEENKDNKTVNTKSRDAFLETLTKIGCQYEIEEEDERINFAFQGEHFIADASNERCYVQLWDTFWGQVELYDIDEFSRLRKAINTANINCDVTTIYTINEAGNNVDVHCKKCVLFLPEIPNIEAYLHAELTGFFRAHHIVSNEMAKLREAEKEEAK